MQVIREFSEKNLRTVSKNGRIIYSYSVAPDTLFCCSLSVVLAENMCSTCFYTSFF